MWSLDRSGAKHELLQQALTHVSIPHLGLQDNGLVIPVVKRIDVGGQIFKEKNEVVSQLTTMLYYFAQYNTLKQMFADVSKIVEQF